MPITDFVDTRGHTVADAIAQERRLHLDNDDGTVLVVTATAATDVITTDDDHGLNVGDAIQFSALTGGTGLAINTTYYVRTVPSATTFTVGRTRKSTTNVDITADATAGTIKAPFVLAQTAAEVNAQLANAAG